MGKNDIDQALSEAGLTEKEIRVYVFLAKHGIQRGGSISKGTKIDRSVVYRILRRLQKKGFIEATLESPTQFVAVSFEKALDVIIKTKEGEANQLRKAKKALLKDWRILSAKSPEANQETFVVIQETKKIFDKISQMIVETNSKFCCLLPVSDLFKADQFGIFDWVSSQANKSNISFDFITELTSGNTKALSILESKLRKDIRLNLIRQDLNSKMFPRIAIKDEDEVLFFTKTDSRYSKEEVAISTNCESLVQTFKRIFREIEENSVPLRSNIETIKEGKYRHIKILRKTLSFQAFNNVTKSINKDDLNQEDWLVDDSTSIAELLTVDEREILECASIIGNEFSLDMLEKITNIHRIKLLKTLMKIESSHGFIHFSVNNFKFLNSSVRNNLLNNIKPELRKTYHSLAARYFEEAHNENLEDFSKDLAYHYYNSDNSQKAIPYLIRAGTDYQNKLNFSEALTSFSSAIEMIGNNMQWDRQKTICLEHLGDVYASIAEHENANKCYQQALSITDDRKIADRISNKIRKKNVIKKDKMSINYYVYGRGEPTLLLIWTPIHFMPQIHYFAQKQKVAVLDLESLWDSRNSPTEHTLNLYTDSLHAIIEDLDDSNLVILGIALGGILAILHEAKYPGLIAKLSLVATPPKSPISEHNEKKRVFEEFWTDALQSPLWGIKELYKRIIQPAWPVYQTNDKISSRIRSIAVKTPLEMRLIAFRLLSETDVESLLGKIKIPTLILHGEKDILPISAAKLMSEKIINSNLVIFEDSKLITLSQPEKFNKVLEDFLIS